MKLTSANLDHLAEVAVAAASEAGDMISRSRPDEVRHKATTGSLASQVVTEIDRRSEAIILEILEPTLEQHELGLLTEERSDDGSRLTADHFWCVDPLDGTLPFIEGTPGYAVSIALVARDGSPKIGVVCDPVSGTVVRAVAGAGAYRNGRTWRPDDRSEAGLSVFFDRSFLQSDDYELVCRELGRIAEELGVRGPHIQATAGGVMNALQTLDRGVACYFKFPSSRGGGHLWDFAATACVFAEAGAVSTDIHGGPLDLNRPGGTQLGSRGVLFATDEALAARIRSLYERIG